MGYNLFQRHGPDGGAATEFAATVASTPPGLDSVPAAGSCVGDSVPAGPDTSVPEVTDFGGESLPAPADATVEGRPTLSHIGRYALKGLLGQGGLGQVHEAWDPLLSRTVAVKTLQFDIDLPSRVSLDRMFLNEARTAAGLSHAHIVTIHDAGLSAYGVYIAMERLHGRDLRQALAAGWQPTAGQAAQLVRRVADALAFAHARGVVHCDIKPANIFLCKHDKPKVLDFGIARVAHGASVPGLEGLVAGSPHYLAPEQLQGARIDVRTDIHALGVVFYELLTGRKAFVGDSVEQISNAVLTFHPAPAHELRPGLSRTLSMIAAKAMARDPDERYSSAEAMASELRRWVSRHAEPVTRHPQASPVAAPAAVPVSAPGGSRPRTRAGVFAGAAIVLVGGIAAAWALRTPAPVAVAAAPATPSAPPSTAAQAHAEEVALTEAVAPAAGPPAPATPAAATRPAATRRANQAAAAPAPKDTRPAVAAVAALTGTLQLAITPWGQVDVDGQPVGTTPPLTSLKLPEGPHTVTVRNDDAVPYTTTVVVNGEMPVVVRYRFGP